MKPRYVLCVDNAGHPASLEVRKVYRVISDTVATRKGLFRVIDESEEDYLYPQSSFVPIELPRTAADRIAS